MTRTMRRWKSQLLASIAIDHVHAARLDEINRVRSDLRAGQVEGRIVLDLA